MTCDLIVLAHSKSKHRQNGISGLETIQTMKRCLQKIYKATEPFSCRLFCVLLTYPTSHKILWNRLVALVPKKELLGFPIIGWLGKNNFCLLHNVLGEAGWRVK